MIRSFTLQITLWDDFVFSALSWNNLLKLLSDTFVNFCISLFEDRLSWLVREQLWTLFSFSCHRCSVLFFYCLILLQCIWNKINKYELNLKKKRCPAVTVGMVCLGSTVSLLLYIFCKYGNNSGLIWQDVFCVPLDSFSLFTIIFSFPILQ